MLSHKELEPIVDGLADRFRVVLPDLPLHGDSEDRPRHPYTPAWFAEVIAGFSHDVLGPRPMIGGHGLGAEIVLHAVARGQITPERLILLPNRLHRRAAARAAAPRLARWRRAPARSRGWAARCRAAPACSRARTSGCGSRRAASRARATSCATRSPTSAATPTSRARGRASRAAGRAGRGASCSTSTRACSMPVLLLWADARPPAPARGRRGGGGADPSARCCACCPAPAT